MDAYKYVGHGDELKIGLLCVGKKHFRFPYGLHEVGIREVERLRHVLVRQPRVVPPLPQVYVCHVVLQWNRSTASIVSTVNVGMSMTILTRQNYQYIISPSLALPTR